MCAPDATQPASDYVTQPEFKQDASLVIEPLSVTFKGVTYPHGKIAYVRGRAPAPVVLVHHNYAGLKQFDIDQAAFLARAGFVGLAVDLYAETASYSYADRSDITDRTRHFKGAFTAMQDLLCRPADWRELMGANLELAFAHPAVAAGRAGAIGYCLGGQSLLEQLRAGHAVQAVVSLHGLLQSRPMHPDEPFNPHRRMAKADYDAEFRPPPSQHTARCIVLIENGATDDHVTAASVAEWEAEMDGAGVDWRFHNHASQPELTQSASSLEVPGYPRERRADRSPLSLAGAHAARLCVGARRRRELAPRERRPAVDAVHACGLRRSLAQRAAAPRALQRLRHGAAAAHRRGRRRRAGHEEAEVEALSRLRHPDFWARAQCNPSALTPTFGRGP